MNFLESSDVPACTKLVLYAMPWIMIFVSSVDQEKFGLKTTAFYKQDEEFNVTNSVTWNAL